MSAPAHAASSLTLPVSVPLAGVQVAANARVPAEFARLDETREFLGGLLSVRLAGTVTRAGHVSVKPGADGTSLLLSVPIRADFRATGTGLTRDFGGAATVTLSLTPTVTPQWEAGVRVGSDYAWTDPLSVELAPGVRVSVQSLVDSQVRAQLSRVAAGVETGVREGARLRERAGRLWARTQQPWTLPVPAAAGPAYARVSPRTLSVTPPRFTPEALKLTLGATFDLSAGLGTAPAGAAQPLPPLTVADLPPGGVSLNVPLSAPYPELSRLATTYAAARPFPLPVPTSPVLRVLDVAVKPSGTRLKVTVRLRIEGPLGLRLPATVDVSGTPALDDGGRIVTLQGVSVTTRREGLSGRLIGWLADSRAQAYLQQAARFDLGPRLDAHRADLQQRLPFSPVPGVTLSGTLGPLSLRSVTPTPDALLVTAQAGGTLEARLDAGALGASLRP
ncbi:DUF4403 family protein [Deinococcus koreensis]|nr:DUF4403 family protein [Deinococcus koreensis]